MATTRNNEKYAMTWKNGAKSIMKYGSAAMIGMEVKDIIQPSDSNEKLIIKIIEKTVTNGDENINITKSNAIIFVILMLIMLYLTVKHIIRKRTDRALIQV